MSRPMYPPNAASAPPRTPSAPPGPTTPRISPMSPTGRIARHAFGSPRYIVYPARRQISPRTATTAIPPVNASSEGAVGLRSRPRRPSNWNGPRARRVAIRKKIPATPAIRPPRTRSSEGGPPRPRVHPDHVLHSGAPSPRPRKRVSAGLDAFDLDARLLEEIEALVAP